MRLAITRGISTALERCELTHLARQPIDMARAHEQHAAYERALAELGCEVRRLAAEPDLPDCVFVEDTAIVLDELAIITRPGALSRRRETGAVAAALAPHRELRFIQAPATLDGGDVLCIDRTLYVGISRRTNAAAIAQVRAHVLPLGYAVTGMAVTGCLHLKSAVTPVAPGTLLINPRWVDPHAFEPLRLIAVDAAEPAAANALLIGNTIVYPSAHPATRERLARHGIQLCSIDVSELLKGEGAVTCCSLVFRAPA